MSLARMSTVPVVVVTAGTTTDRYNATTTDWANATRRNVLGFFDDGTSTEVTDGRDALVSNATFFLPPDDPITGRDRIEIDGATYELNGAPSKPRTPRGMHHLECRLLLVEG